MAQVVEESANARRIAVEALLDYERRSEFADELLSRQLDQSGLRGAERALAADLYWGTIRWKGRLDAVIQSTFVGDYHKSHPLIRVLLRLGTYQLYVQDRIPDHAAVSQTVEIAVNRMGRAPAGLVNAILRKLARERERWEQIDPAQDDATRRAFLYSHPRWIVKQLTSIFGPDVVDSALEANNRRALLSVRMNGAPNTHHDLRGALREHGIRFQPSRLLPNYFRTGPGSITKLAPLLETGELTVQDESSGLVVELLAPEPGDSVLDLCAAPGGKTLAIFDKLREHGHIVANDISESRMALVQSNLQRMHAELVETTTFDAREFPDRKFDKVLVDAPCSALGLLRRQPDVRWRRKSDHIERQVHEQIEILRRAAELVNIGGVLVYSTCSILPVENHGIAMQFLKEFPEFQREDARGFVSESVITEHGDLQTYTHVHDCDGAYAVRLRRIT